MSNITNQLTRTILLISFFIGLSFQGKAQETDYQGFKCLDFKCEGRDAKVVFPKEAEPGRHWIWRARFWGHEPQTEIALLEKGFHLVYVDAADLCADPEAVALWNRFYDYLIKEYQLNPKTVLEGMSRGGLYIYNWGSENVEKEACGDIKIIIKEGIGHHPHSLIDPAPIVSFILTNTAPGLLDKQQPYESKMAINFRGNMDNCRIKFEKEKKGRVVFLGGSITYMTGWRDMVLSLIHISEPTRLGMISY